MSVFLISYGQNQTSAPPDIIRSEIKDTVTPYGPGNTVRNVKQARNGDILVIFGSRLEVDRKSHIDQRDKRELYQSVQVFSLAGEEISAIKHTIYDLFTKVTFLFTIQISQAEKYQSRFAASILTGYETIMILPKPAG